jgi:hypothetical protein
MIAEDFIQPLRSLRAYTEEEVDELYNNSSDEENINAAADQ